MMKRILTILAIAALAGCVSSSGLGPGWTPQHAAYPETAQSAPSSLTARPDPPTLQGARPSAAPAAVAAAPLPGQEFPVTVENGAGLPSAASAMPPVKVALLLPLSGDQAELGQGMLQAAQLALFDMGYSGFELMPRDTRGTPQGAEQAANGAIAEGAQLILGPLFAASARAVRGIAARRNVNMITFSTDWSVAGGNSFVMGFLPFAQVQRITAYAAVNGYRDIGVFSPATDYGNVVIETYRAAAGGLGLRTVDIARFSGLEGDLSTALRRFTRYDERAARAEAAGPDAPPASPPFQAVLLPLGGEDARTAADLLSYFDLAPDAVKRLGTGLWDDPGLSADIALAGAWFAAPSPDLRRGFETRYRALYGSRPPRLATLAYDATALAAVLARMGYDRSGRPAFGRAALTNPNGFSGIDGIFRFRPDGLVERGLAVLEFHRGLIRVIDPAPTTFQESVR